MKLRQIIFPAAIVLGLTMTPQPAQPHHSNVAYRVTTVLTMTGTVKSFKWSNPHTWLTITVMEDGQPVEWAVEGRAPGVLRRAGWSPSSLKEGEVVTVDYSPAKDGSKVGIIARVTKADGTILPNR